MGDGKDEITSHSHAGLFFFFFFFSSAAALVFHLLESAAAIAGQNMN